MTKLCQGPECHTYDTTDRKRGPKGNKRNQTRTLSRYAYGNNNFCTLNCQNDWWALYGNQAVDYFGRVFQPKVLSAENGTQLYSGGAAVGPGTFISTNVEYIRITNLDTSNYITLNIWQDATHQAAFRLLAGESFILGETLGFDVSTDIDSVGAGVTFTKIEALANSANVDVEVFVASK